MADLQTQRIVGDLGSQEHAHLQASYNGLLDVLSDLITGLKTAADVPAVQALATTAEAAMEANVKKLESVPDLPLSPTSTVV